MYLLTDQDRQTIAEYDLRQDEIWLQRIAAPLLERFLGVFLEYNDQGVPTGWIFEFDPGSRGLDAALDLLKTLLYLDYEFVAQASVAFHKRRRTWQVRCEFYGPLRVMAKRGTGQWVS